MKDEKKKVKKFALIRGLEKKFGKDKKGRIVDTIKKEGSKGLPMRNIKKSKY